MTATLRSLSPPALVVAGLLAALAVFVALAGQSPLRAAVVFLGASLGSWDGLLESIVRAIPIAIAGVGMCVAFRARLFNVGADGQLIVGAILCVAVALAMPGLSPWLLLPLFVLASMIGGGLWGGLAGWLRARVNANEIIVTIMLNYVAIQLLAWVIRGPMQESMKIFPRTDAIPDSLIFAPLIGGSRLHAGLFIALAVAFIVAFVFARTRFGFRLRAVGESRDAARYGGTNDKAMIILAMAASGALAGLAGAVEMAGIHGRLQDGFSGGVGIAAIAAALLARLNPVAVLLTALLFGLLSVGTGALQRELNIPFPLVSIIEGFVIFGFLAVEYLQRRRRTAREAAHG